MLSRVAESIFWMNRYIERAENVARFIDSNFQMILDLPSGAVEQWEPLITSTGDRDLFFNSYDTAERENVIHFLTFDCNNPNSIISCLKKARENARSVREYISSEVWQSVNRFYHQVNDASKCAQECSFHHQFFVEIMMASHLFIGVTESTMSHREGWHFGRLGRMLERADKTSRILDVKYFIMLPSVTYVGSPYDNVLWACLLRSASAFESYRKEFGLIDGKNIIDFLVLDSKFPRAIHHCLILAEGSMRAISGTSMGSYRNRPGQALGRLLSEFNYLAVEEIIEEGTHEFLGGTQEKLKEIGVKIQETFFDLRPIAEVPSFTPVEYLQ